jgi:8-oxo-dGTP diphosphatase
MRVPTIPEYGTASPGAESVLRPGGYAIILRATGEVAVVATPAGVALPGGGQEPRETPEQATIREVAEECGLQIDVGDYIGIADELVFTEAEGTHYRKRCAFFLASVVGKLGEGEADHELRWLPAHEAVASLRHECQRRAVTEACQLTKT